MFIYFLGYLLFIFPRHVRSTSDKKKNLIIISLFCRSYYFVITKQFKKSFALLKSHGPNFLGLGSFFSPLNDCQTITVAIKPAQLSWGWAHFQYEASGCLWGTTSACQTVCTIFNSLLLYKYRNTWAWLWSILVLHYLCPTAVCLP